MNVHKLSRRPLAYSKLKQEVGLHSGVECDPAYSIRLHAAQEVPCLCRSRPARNRLSDYGEVGRSGFRRTERLNYLPASLRQGGPLGITSARWLGGMRAPLWWERAVMRPPRVCVTPRRRHPHRADHRGDDRDLVQLLQMWLDLAHHQPAATEREEFLVNPGEPPHVFGTSWGSNVLARSRGISRVNGHRR